MKNTLTVSDKPAKAKEIVFPSGYSILERELDCGCVFHTGTKDYIASLNLMCLEHRSAKELTLRRHSTDQLRKAATKLVESATGSKKRHDQWASEEEKQAAISAYFRHLRRNR